LNQDEIQESIRAVGIPEFSNPFLQTQLPMIFHLEANSGKSVLLRSILATHLLPKTCGGHGLPSVLIDADNAFDVWLLAKVLQVQ